MILASQFSEYLTIAIIAVFVIAITLVVYYIVTGRKKKDDEEIEISPNFETKPVEQPAIEPIQPVSVDEPVEKPSSELEEVSEEPEETEVVLEDTTTDEQKVLEEEKTDNNIQTLLNQMQQDLDKANNKEDFVESANRYEDDEEANAIISYKELMKYKNNSEKDMVLEDKSKEEIKEAIKEPEPPKEEVKKFKRSEFISPIFGYNEETNVTYREIKRPPKKEKTHEWESDRMLKNLEDDAAEVIEFEEPKKEVKEINETDKFLDELVDFRNKLN